MAHEHHDQPVHAHPGETGSVVHASADDEYRLTPPGSGHEHTDTNVWIIVKFGLWLAVSAIVIHVGMWFAFVLLVQWKEGGEPEYPLAQGQEERLPAGARLQPIPVNDIYQFRRQEEDVLQNYRWIDRDGGRVQIPISEAMRLTVERGLPTRAQRPESASAVTPEAAAPVPPQAAPAGTPQAAPAVTPGLLPADSSAGRTLERRRQ